MPDGSTTDPRPKVEPGASSSGSVSHPLMGSTRKEPAIRNTAKRASSPVNIRMTVPILGRRFYFSIAGGRERRSKERLALERQANPFRTKSNITFILIGAVIIYMLTLGTFLAFASVLES
jgi:hypothetical protein